MEQDKLTTDPDIDDALKKYRDDDEAYAMLWAIYNEQRNEHEQMATD